MAIEQKKKGILYKIRKHVLRYNKVKKQEEQDIPAAPRQTITSTIKLPPVFWLLLSACILGYMLLRVYV